LFGLTGEEELIYTLGEYGEKSKIQMTNVKNCIKNMAKKKEVKNKIAIKKVAHEKVMKRIARIEGQIGGIKRMVESERECLDIIQQISAIRQATAMLGIELLKDEFLCKRKAHKEIDEKFLQTLFKVS